MKKTNLEKMKEQLAESFDSEAARRIGENMQAEYEKLCAGDGSLPEDFVKHAHNNIYPVAAAYRALMCEGIESAEAAKLAGDAFLKLMEITADKIRSAMKVPGLYRAMPGLWKTLMPKLFSESSGFRFNFYPTDGKRVKFDMSSCPYHALCKKLDVEILAPVFCATDDVCYGNMHPKLIWNRTQTISRGADYCDFDLYIGNPGSD